MEQYEITSPIPLLDEQGNLSRPGWARKGYPVYERSKVKGRMLRLKERDYYLVTNGRFGLALTISRNSCVVLDTISLLDFEAGWEVTKSPVNVMTRGKTALSTTSAEGVSASAGKDYALVFLAENGGRTLVAHMENFKDGLTLDANLKLSEEPEESLVICRPFEKPGHFYYNQKINCMRASGTVQLGEDTYRFQPENSFGVLDWSRGVWSGSITRYWSSASGEVDGVSFGFNFGYGFGDTWAATENVLIYNGRIHKLNYVIFHIPLKKGKYDYLAPWTIESDDGRVKLNFVPVMDHTSGTEVKLTKSDRHQVFGRFSGKVVLDGGTELKLKDFFGFAEKVVNQW